VTRKEPRAAGKAQDACSICSCLFARGSWRLAVLLLPLLNGCSGTEDRVLEESFDRLYAVDPSANITIENRDGAIVVYGSNKNEVHVHAVKKAYRRDRISRIVIDVSTKPGAVSIITKFPPKVRWGLFDRSGTVDYTIIVPATASISRADLEMGEMCLDGMRGGEVRARLGDGRMFARNCFTDLDLRMERGTLTLSYDWWKEEKLSVRATVAQGNTWAFLPGDAAFHLLANVAHGRVGNDFNTLPVAENTSPNRVKVDQLVNGGDQATIKMYVREGDIKIVEANQ
jgi:hypothetical protein